MARLRPRVIKTDVLALAFPLCALNMRLL